MIITFGTFLQLIGLFIIIPFGYHNLYKLINHLPPSDGDVIIMALGIILFMFKYLNK